MPLKCCYLTKCGLSNVTGRNITIVWEPWLITVLIALHVGQGIVLPVGLEVVAALLVVRPKFCKDIMAHLN